MKSCRCPLVLRSHSDDARCRQVAAAHTHDKIDSAVFEVQSVLNLKVEVIRGWGGAIWLSPRERRVSHANDSIRRPGRVGCKGRITLAEVFREWNLSKDEDCVGCRHRSGRLTVLRNSSTLSIDTLAVERR